jgi:flagellar hook assembly protein FlgD
MSQTKHKSGGFFNMSIRKSQWVWVFVLMVLLLAGSQQAFAVNPVITITDVEWRNAQHPNHNYVEGSLTSSEGLPSSTVFKLINIHNVNQVYTVPATIQWSSTGSGTWNWDATLNMQSVPAGQYNTQVNASFKSGATATFTYGWDNTGPDCQGITCE